MQVSDLPKGTLFTLRFIGGPYDWSYVAGSKIFEYSPHILPKEPDKIWKLIHSTFEWKTINDEIINGTLVEVIVPEAGILYFPLLDLYTSGINSSFTIENPITPERRDIK